MHTVKCLPLLLSQTRIYIAAVAGAAFIYQLPALVYSKTSGRIPCSSLFLWLKKILLWWNFASSSTSNEHIYRRCKRLEFDIPTVRSKCYPGLTCPAGFSGPKYKLLTNMFVPSASNGIYIAAPRGLLSFLSINFNISTVCSKAVDTPLCSSVFLCRQNHCLCLPLLLP